MTTFWTDDRVEQLKAMWLRGMSASKIAAQIEGATRNSVIGKTRRLKLDGRLTESGCVEARQSKHNRTVQANRRDRGLVVPTVQRCKSQHSETKFHSNPTIDAPDVVTSRRLSIIDLKAMECRWPDEDGDPVKGIPHSFCGNRTADGSSYCSSHARLSLGLGTASERSAVRVAIAIVGAEA